MTTPSYCQWKTFEKSFKIIGWEKRRKEIFSVRTCWLVGWNHWNANTFRIRNDEKIPKNLHRIHSVGNNRWLLSDFNGKLYSVWNVKCLRNWTLIRLYNGSQSMLRWLCTHCWDVGRDFRILFRFSCLRFHVTVVYVI